MADLIPPLDRGFTLGDGLFETVLWAGGELRALDAHLRRLADGCAALRLPPPDLREAEQRLRQAVEAAGLAGGRAAVRLTLTAGEGGRGLDRPAQLHPRLVATCAPAPRPTAPARLVTATVRRNEHSPASRLKTLAYLDNVLARIEARDAGADEALMLNTAGELACAAAANLFWVAGSRLFTPALSCGVLAGIMRGEVLRAAARAGVEVVEVAAGREALGGAEALFLTNSLIGVRTVCALDDVSFTEHPLVARLAAVI